MNNSKQTKIGRKKGCIPWNKGKKMSKKYLEWFTKINIGRKHTKETKEKFSKIRKGKNNGNWKGGITPLILSCRTCDKYKEWHKLVFERDYWTCQECGIKSGDIIAHHIKQFAQIFYDNNLTTIDEALACEELWDVDNGVTVCIECHKDTFHFNGNQYQTINQPTKTKG